MKTAARLLFLAFPLSFAACIKGKQADPVTLTVAQKVAGNWQLRTFSTDSTFNSGAAPKSVNAFAALPACRQDDVFQFGTDAILLMQEGPLNCNPGSGNSVVLGYWQVLPGDKKMVMEDPDLPLIRDTLTLIAVTDTEMQLEGTVAFKLPDSSATGQATLRKTYGRKK